MGAQARQRVELPAVVLQRGVTLAEQDDLAIGEPSHQFRCPELYTIGRVEPDTRRLADRWFGRGGTGGTFAEKRQAAEKNG